MSEGVASAMSSVREFTGVRADATVVEYLKPFRHFLEPLTSTRSASTGQASSSSSAPTAGSVSTYRS